MFRIFSKPARVYRAVRFSPWLLLAFASGLAFAQEHPQLIRPAASLESLRQQADVAFENKDWPMAVEIFEKILEASPDDPRVLIRLGFSLHSMGKLEEANVIHEKAAENRRTRGSAFYNWACTLCAQQKAGEALDKLEAALDAGFSRPDKFRDDDHLALLRDDDRFAALAKRYEQVIEEAERNPRVGIGVMSSDPPPSEVELRQEAVALKLEFRLGEWTVATHDGEVLGRSVIQRLDESGNVEESFTGKDDREEVVISSYNPESREWTQKWIETRDDAIRVSSIIRNPGSLEMTGEATLEDGETIACRIIFGLPYDEPQVEAGWIHQQIRVSRDGGQSWEMLLNRKYTRVGE